MNAIVKTALFFVLSCHPASADLRSAVMAALKSILLRLGHFATASMSAPIGQGDGNPGNGLRRSLAEKETRYV